ncbi:hypothetical protein VTJ04DRAFT_2668 [Mycothermus thermophilus]|uniref:uncharacterized protein n=1 Tax=Humicola insolens TaxID=85995 RepID=UPI003743455B
MEPQHKEKEKDMRSAELIVRYEEPAAKGDVVEFSTTLASTLPMAAVFTRNKYISWASVIFSLQTWLGESEDAKRNSSTPGYFNVGMALMTLVVNYLPLFLPPPPQRGAAPAPAATTA